MGHNITWEILRTLDSSTMVSDTTWYPIGGPLLFPGLKVKMVNTSNVLVTVSIDGVNAYDVCPSESFWLYDETINVSQTSASIPQVQQGTQFYCQSLIAGTGLIYLVSQYIT